jgi:hypothetical protein
MAGTAAPKDMIAVVRAGLSQVWDKLIHAVEQALSPAVTDSAASIVSGRCPIRNNGNDTRSR